VQLDDLEVRRVEPVDPLLRRQRPRDVVRPPLAVRPRVAVAEPGDVVPVPRDEEDEVVALGVERQAVPRPFVREGARAERGSVDLAQLCAKGQRVGRLDQVACRSASRSTTTCVSGSAKRWRAFSTTPRSSQCDLPGGCVEMISSSGYTAPPAGPCLTLMRGISYEEENVRWAVRALAIVEQRARAGSAMA